MDTIPNDVDKSIEEIVHASTKTLLACGCKTVIMLVQNKDGKLLKIDCGDVFNNFGVLSAEYLHQRANMITRFHAIDKQNQIDAAKEK